MEDVLKIDTLSMEEEREFVKDDVLKIKELLKDIVDELADDVALYDGIREDANMLLEFCASLEGMNQYEEAVEREYTNCERNIGSLIANMERSV